MMENAAIMYRQGIDPGARAASNSRPSLNRRASAPAIGVTDASLSFKREEGDAISRAFPHRP